LLVLTVLFITSNISVLYFIFSSTDASPDTFETPQPTKVPMSSRTVDPTDLDDGKHDGSKSKDTG